MKGHKPPPPNAVQGAWANYLPSVAAAAVASPAVTASAAPGQCAAAAAAVAGPVATAARMEHCVYGGSQPGGEAVVFAARDVRLFPLPVKAPPPKQALAAAGPVAGAAAAAVAGGPVTRPVAQPVPGPVAAEAPVQAAARRVGGICATGCRPMSGRPVPPEFLVPVWSTGRHPRAEGFRLKVGDLPFDVTEYTIRGWLAASGVGMVRDVSVASRARSGALMAFITIADAEEAVRAASAIWSWWVEVPFAVDPRGWRWVPVQWMVDRDD